MWKDAWGANMGIVEGEKEEGMSDGEATSLYRKALSEAAEIAAESVSSGFETCRQRTIEEFERFLGRLG
jgi:hypothetical protein